MQPSKGPSIIYIHPPIIRLEKSPKFLRGPKNNDQAKPKFSNNFQQSPYQQNFLNQSPPPSFQNSHMEIRLSNMERKVDTLVKSQETLAQVMTRIEMQLSQQANPISERQKGTLPSQPLSNPKNPRQANEA